MAKKVGITGGIGSGKTTVCKIFEFLGVPIFYSDEVAKNILVTNQSVIRQIQEVFGEEAYNLDSTYNKQFVASKIFNDRSLLLKLNSIIHPIVIEENLIWNNKYKDSPYIINESALIFESNKYKLFDKIIVVYCPEYIKIDRVMKRDNLNKDQVQERIKNQLADIEKIRLSDMVIINNNEISLLSQIHYIHNKLTN